MKEDFLHYVWRYKKFPLTGLATTSGETLEIFNTGQYLRRSGPDFFNAQIIIGTQRWAGNIEIHLKSSDWYLHHHHHDAAYDGVILHVVWQHDAAIFRKDNTEIPTLELRHHIAPTLLRNYESLIHPKSWIYCEKELTSIDPFILGNWMERLFLERLERKSGAILQLLDRYTGDWEAVLFCLLAKNFGLNTNGAAFLEMAESIPFPVIRKERFEITALEALFFGRCNLLAGKKQDQYFGELQSVFDYLCDKHRLVPIAVEPLQFFRLRPDNFPTIRLAQLAMLYHKKPHLFTDLVHAADSSAIYDLLQVQVSPYWQEHYQFDRESPFKRRYLSRSFMDLIIINTVIPFRFAYAKKQGADALEILMALLQSMAPESNSILDHFSTFGIKPKNAFESQSLLELKQAFCDKSRCLECAIGTALLKS
ncbi:DUF2851 domain-containing protein [Flavobacterium magnum]|uniref:DUF2851 domain-containing protein n=1 Tax=Flavobacterium magnum TaxID=2162713 RepID=A0A2S0RDC3_9FLAO|nr:DUF2851 family protein [Flavobacterium magnum]AWA29743.1 DUF2851 domain-containing protein [Flavobacterium magnum]